MPLEGYIDAADGRQVRGWVWDAARPDERLAVDVFADGDRPVGTVVADGPRADLAAAGKGDGGHAFAFEYDAEPSPRPLVARVAGWLIPLGQPPSPSRYAGRFLHPMDRGLPAVATGFTAVPAEPDDPPIVARLVEAYHRAVADAPTAGTGPDLWSAMAAGPHREIVQLLVRRDVPAIARYLADAHAKGLTSGVAQGDALTGLLRVRPDERDRAAGPLVDQLVSLAEFVGVLDVECSDQVSTWGDRLYGDVQAMVDGIGAAIGIPLVRPQVIGSSFGLRTRDGIVSGRDLLALHAALRLRQLLAELPPDRHVCEIGGGLGGVACYAHLLHLGRYTIIDLPIIGLLQGYFLLRAVPDARVRLYGEPGGDADISLLPPHAFHGEPTMFDVLFNQDSLPEMHRDIGVAYLRRAAANVRHLFLSVNQEARAPQAGDARQTVVRELAAEAGGLRLLSRHRHWLRAGYVEEAYRTCR